MLHKTRQWHIAKVETPEELAKKLTEMTWCGCNGFSVVGHDNILFLNDSTSGDGAQEYAVTRNGIQVESITFSWCNYEEALRYINECINGMGTEFSYVLPKTAINTSEHHRCHLCA